MDPDAIAPLTALLSIGVMMLIGMKMWLSAKTARLTASGGAEVKQLREAVDRLDEQVEVLREHLTDLGERMDFAERLLARAEGRGRLGPGEG